MPREMPKSDSLAILPGTAMIPSLSTVARAITGTSWNGPRFFGLRIKRDADQVEAGQ